jgi:hypothetical protein
MLSLIGRLQFVWKNRVKLKNDKRSDALSVKKQIERAELLVVRLMRYEVFSRSE